VQAYVAHLRSTTADGSAPRSRKQRAKAISPRALRWLLARKREDLEKEDQARLDQLLNLSPEVQAVYALLQAFVKMVRERKHQDLRSWMGQAIKSGIPELKSFAAGIERDYDAVHAALRVPWSQGPTEGKVNKLKTLKRVMYGRVGFALLRQRLLHDASCSHACLTAADEGKRVSTGSPKTWKSPTWLLHVISPIWRP
jgi:transposase